MVLRIEIGLRGGRRAVRREYGWTRYRFDVDSDSDIGFVPLQMLDGAEFAADMGIICGGP